MYYVGGNVLLKFAVLEDGKGIAPSSVGVIIYNPSGKMTQERLAQIEQNEVSYIIPAEVVDEVGKYVAVFRVSFFDDEERTHTIEFSVEALPINAEDAMKIPTDAPSVLNIIGRFMEQYKRSK